MRYFDGCTTLDDVKKAFRDYARRLHPDNGGDGEAFKAMQAQYKTAFERCKDTHRAADGTTYTKQTTETPEEFAAIINAIIHLQGIKIEIIGAWVWVSGDTYPHREAIKSAGFWYSKSKKAWYHNGDKEPRKRRGHYSMDGLRAKWGAQEVATVRQACIA